MTDMDLECRIQALEDGVQFDATQVAIREREEEFLLTLRTIKDQIAVESQQQQSGGGIANSTALATLQSENEILKAKIAKQEYRIKHLIEGMEQLLEASATTTTTKSES